MTSQLTRRLGTAIAVVAALVLSTGAATVVRHPGAQQAGPAPSVRLSEPEAFGPGLATVTGSSYAFSKLLNGVPVRWNPCKVISWKYSVTNAPYGGLDAAKAAVARIAKMTGTTWSYTGNVVNPPSSSWLPTSTSSVRPVLIGWSDAAHSDLLRNQPSNVLGVARTAWFTVSKDGTSVTALKAAVIALDRTDRLAMSGGKSWRTVLLHELGHAMGLAHAGSSAEIMYPSLQDRFTDYQTGDRQGLYRVGRAMGCLAI